MARKRRQLSQAKQDARVAYLQPKVDAAMKTIIGLPENIKEDATQEAWVAALLGQDIRKAVLKFIHKENQYTMLKRGGI